MTDVIHAPHTERAKYFLRRCQPIAPDEQNAGFKQYLGGTSVGDLSSGWLLVHCVEFLRWGLYFDEPGAGELAEEVMTKYRSTKSKLESNKRPLERYALVSTPPVTAEIYDQSCSGRLFRLCGL